MEDHLIRMFLNRAEKYGTKQVFRYRDKDNHYQAINWKQLKAMVDDVLSALTVLQCSKSEPVGIFSSNRYEWFLTDLGILAAGAVVVPFYATASREQVKYILDETRMKIIFVGDKAQLELVLSLMEEGSTLEKIVVFNNIESEDDRVIYFNDFLKLPAEKNANITIEEVEENYRADDLATIIYTSGTTGEPKGAMLTHDNFIFCFHIHDKRLNVNENDVSLCFLPLSHVFERLWSQYLLHCGAVNVFLENPREVIDVLSVVKPTVMCTVPRFFDKTLKAIHTEAEKWPAFKQKIFNWSLEKGHEVIEYQCRAQDVPFGLKWKHKIADLLVLKKLRGIFGGNIKTMPCSGSAIDTQVLKFFHAMGIFVNYGYGATETTATVSCFKTDRYYYGTCGTVMPAVDVLISENGEILVKGRSVFKGYFKKQKETDEALKDGWFQTGDEGYLDHQNNLVMLDRIKDLMKTSVGKYVSPQKLELLLSHDELVEHIIVVGDNRQYVTALVVPVMEKLKQVAGNTGISFTDEEDLIQAPGIYQLFENRFNQLQQNLTPYERIVKFTLLTEPFSIEAGTMTNTLKLRRRS
ncbi:MAG: long-chain fatty acid--CoA ligase, partial [Bacteroidales bacterium]